MHLDVVTAPGTCSKISFSPTQCCCSFYVKKSCSDPIINGKRGLFLIFDCPGYMSLCPQMPTHAFWAALLLTTVVTSRHLRHCPCLPHELCFFCCCLGFLHPSANISQAQTSQAPTTMPQRDRERDRVNQSVRFHISTSVEEISSWRREFTANVLSVLSCPFFVGAGCLRTSHIRRLDIQTVRFNPSY